VAYPSISSIMQKDGSLRCARCCGTQFEARHSAGRKLTFGIATLLASADEVHCLACAAKYSRRVEPPKPDPPATPSPGAAFRKSKRKKTP